MNSLVYIKALSVLIVLSLSILLGVFLLKKLKLVDKFTGNQSDSIQIIESKKIDHNKTFLVIKNKKVTYTCILAENYGILLDKKYGGEGRIRTYERTRRADLQSAAFGHSATSPKK
jgi:hypothetical protein